MWLWTRGGFRRAGFWSLAFVKTAQLAPRLRASTGAELGYGRGVFWSRWGLYALLVGRVGFGSDHAQLRAASKGRKKTIETTLPWAKVIGVKRDHTIIT